MSNCKGDQRRSNKLEQLTNPTSLWLRCLFYFSHLLHFWKTPLLLYFSYIPCFWRTTSKTKLKWVIFRHTSLRPSLTSAYRPLIISVNYSKEHQWRFYKLGKPQSPTSLWFSVFILLYLFCCVSEEQHWRPNISGRKRKLSAMPLFDVRWPLRSLNAT